VLNPSEHFEATRTMGLCFELVYLDDYWTRTASEGMVVDAESLKAIIDAMDQRFAELADSLDSFLAIARAHDERMRTVFDAVVVGSPLPGGGGRFIGPPLAEGQRARIGEVIERRGGGDFAAATVSAAEDLGGRLDGEREQMRAEFERVASGSSSDGDMSVETLEDVVLIAAGASAVLGPEAGAVVLAAAGLWDLIFG
jgi:hypothetical protein